MPDIYSFHLLNHSVTEVAGLPVIIAHRDAARRASTGSLKAIEDYVLASLLLVCSPCR